ncbi:MAG: alkaline phosphatase family protein, partial [Candidatus Thorarchaeota archaeon]
MEKFNRKILIIGIDGASWDILDDILNNGYMPYLKNLKENGAYGILNSTLPPISTSAWSTIQTGVDAIKNHVYEYRYFNKNTKQIGIVNSYLLENTIWNILGNVGKKVGVVNIPMTYPPKKINGYMVTGILTPSIESNFTYPPELKEKILEKIPDYQLKYTEEKRYGNPIYNTEKFIQQRIKNIKDRTKVCLYLINNHKIDLLMVNFQANDILQHCLWGFIDKTHEL